MDTKLSSKDQKVLLNALEKAKEMTRKMEERSEQKRWSELELPTDFANILARLSKNDLSDIRTNWGVSGASALKKQDLIDVLTLQLAEKLPAVFDLFDKARYDIVKKIADKGGCAYVPLESRQLEYFQSRGILFPGMVNGKKVLCIPPEVLECFKAIDNAEYRQQIRSNTERIKLVHGLLFYYGTLSLKELCRQIHLHLGTDEQLTGEIIYLLEGAEKFHQQARLGAEGYSSGRVWDPEKVKDEHRSRKDLPFFPFTTAELIKAGEPDFVDRNPSFTAFVEFIRKNYEIPLKEAEQLVGECVYAIQIGESPGQILQFLQTQLEINELNVMTSFMDRIVMLHNNTKQWFLKGHAPSEMSRRADSAITASGTAGEVIDFATRRKVGRNDPCPCGTGKKFKKCCGN
ncbi:YecA family protein [Paenibacillus thalictri]|uniref:Zinc chelation protein SecC n=1 Tax=Paenibacillus thalictri TaxID=2527873 RepID=A0A4Q9DWL5_9BACL|nr:SEC-C metal-binding domain-containing protein [Paenibacillus thalictri]TBL80796.1 hypothetical protein EYB31_06120 [Paenibacillus thalictri]